MLGRRFGRAARSLTGADEQLLDLVPTERPKYTALGGVVFGTATIAALSMTMALSEVVGGFQLSLLAFGLVWGAFVLNLDRWLVTSSVGTRWHRRVTVLLPRLVLAFFFGVVIAEPLVLRVFEPAIEQYINDQRQQDARNLTSLLLRCNPDPTADAQTRQAAQGADCAHHQLDLQAAPAAMAQELAGYQNQADQLRQDIDATNKEQSARDELARNECAGTPGPGTTGKAGRGRECIEREKEANDYRSTHPTADKQATLAGLNDKITKLRATLDTSQRTYQAARDAAVRQQVDELVAHQGPIGLLERFRALDELTSANLFLTTATWFIRLFFIGVDCLPVLVKLFGGVTTYEELVDMQTVSAKRVFEQKVRTRETAETSRLRGDQIEAEHEFQKRRATAEQNLRLHEAELDLAVDQHVDAAAAKLRQQRGRRQSPPTIWDAPTVRQRVEDTMPIARRPV
ncbi:DUF4407 domain-containing protein [Kutzneria kofuensis]